MRPFKRPCRPERDTRWISRQFEAANRSGSRCRARPSVIDRGQIVGLHGTVQDITERKANEDQLRHQAEILEVIQDAVVETDLHFRITSWNPAAERIYGWRAEEVLGKHAKDCSANGNDG